MECLPEVDVRILAITEALRIKLKPLYIIVYEMFTHLRSHNDLRAFNTQLLIDNIAEVTSEPKHYKSITEGVSGRFSNMLSECYGFDINKAGDKILIQYQENPESVFFDNSNSLFKYFEFQEQVESITKLGGVGTTLKDL